MIASGCWMSNIVLFLVWGYMIAAWFCVSALRALPRSQTSTLVNKRKTQRFNWNQGWPQIKHCRIDRWLIAYYYFDYIIALYKYKSSKSLFRLIVSEYVFIIASFWEKRNVIEDKVRMILKRIATAVSRSAFPPSSLLSTSAQECFCTKNFICVSYFGGKLFLAKKRYQCEYGIMYSECNWYWCETFHVDRIITFI